MTVSTPNLHDAMMINTDDLADAKEIAEILGLANPRSVSVYRRRHRSFPQPVIERPRCVLWLRPEVAEWAARRERERGD